MFERKKNETNYEPQKLWKNVNTYLESQQTIWHSCAWPCKTHWHSSPLPQHLWPRVDHSSMTHATVAILRLLTTSYGMAQSPWQALSACRTTITNIIHHTIITTWEDTHFLKINFVYGTGKSKWKCQKYVF